MLFYGKLLDPLDRLTRQRRKMAMRRLLLAIAVQALAIAALAPRPAHALLCCDPNGYYTTSTLTGSGPSCGQAQSNLAAKLRDEETLDDCGSYQNLCIGSAVQYTDSC